MAETIPAGESYVALVTWKLKTQDWLMANLTLTRFLYYIVNSIITFQHSNHTVEEANFGHEV